MLNTEFSGSGVGEAGRWRGRGTTHLAPYMHFLRVTCERYGETIKRSTKQSGLPERPPGIGRIRNFSFTPRCNSSAALQLKECCERNIVTFTRRLLLFSLKFVSRTE